MILFTGSSKIHILKCDMPDFLSSAKESMLSTVLCEKTVHLHVSSSVTSGNIPPFLSFSENLPARQ
jgi:hypothetical protein